MNGVLHVPQSYHYRWERAKSFFICILSSCFLFFLCLFSSTAKRMELFGVHNLHHFSAFTLKKCCKGKRLLSFWFHFSGDGQRSDVGFSDRIELPTEFFFFTFLRLKCDSDILNRRKIWFLATTARMNKKWNWNDSSLPNAHAKCDFHLFSPIFLFFLVHWYFFAFDFDGWCKKLFVLRLWPCPMPYGNMLSQSIITHLFPGLGASIWR